MATNPPIQIGELTNVPAPGAGVKSDWAQQVSSRIVHRFATVAARNAAIPAPVEGMVAYIVALHAWTLYDGAVWVEPGKQTAVVLPASNGMTNGQTITGTGFTVLSPRRRYSIGLLATMFKGGAAGTITIIPTGGGFGTPVQVTCNLGTPESRTFYAQWPFSPTPNQSGALTLNISAGTVDVFANSVLTITDVGSI